MSAGAETASNQSDDGMSRQHSKALDDVMDDVFKEQFGNFPREDKIYSALVITRKDVLLLKREVSQLESKLQKFEIDGLELESCRKEMSTTRAELAATQAEAKTCHETLSSARAQVTISLKEILENAVKGMEPRFTNVEEMYMKEMSTTRAELAATQAEAKTCHETLSSARAQVTISLGEILENTVKGMEPRFANLEGMYMKELASARAEFATIRTEKASIVGRVQTAQDSNLKQELDNAVGALGKSQAQLQSNLVTVRNELATALGQSRNEVNTKLNEVVTSLNACQSNLNTALATSRNELNAALGTSLDALNTKIEGSKSPNGREIESVVADYFEKARDGAQPGGITREELTISLRKESEKWSERCLGEISNVECIVSDKLARHEKTLLKMIAQAAAEGRDYDLQSVASGVPTSADSVSNQGTMSPTRRKNSNESNGSMDYMVPKFQALQEEMQAMKVTWHSSHTAMTQDMRELMVKFKEATPLELAKQLKVLSNDLSTEVAERRNVVQRICIKLEQLGAPMEPTGVGLLHISQSQESIPQLNAMTSSFLVASTSTERVALKAERPPPHNSWSPPANMDSSGGRLVSLESVARQPSAPVASLAVSPRNSLGVKSPPLPDEKLTWLRSSDQQKSAGLSGHRQPSEGVVPNSRSFASGLPSQGATGPARGSVDRRIAEHPSLNIPSTSNMRLGQSPPLTGRGGRTPLGSSVLFSSDGSSPREKDNRSPSSKMSAMVPGVGPAPKKRTTKS